MTASRHFPLPDSDVVRVSHVGYRRDQTEILRDVCWQVRRGQHWAVIGPNGCGKTTLLKIVAGWDFPTTGEVSILGQTFGDCVMADVRRRVGWVSNLLDSMIRPRLLALGVVLTGLRAELGIREDPSDGEMERACEALDQVGCRHRAELPFALLSQGERMRVLIARALMASPGLLILDEPCVGLDPVARDDFLGTLSDLAGEAAAPTLIMVTHHTEEIVPAITDVLALREGRVIAAGAKAGVLTPAVLSEAFGRPFTVASDGVRWLAHPLPGPHWASTADRVKTASPT